MRAIYVPPNGGGVRAVVSVGDDLGGGSVAVWSTRETDGVQVRHVVSSAALEPLNHTGVRNTTAITAGEVALLRRGLWSLASEADWSLAMQLLDRLEADAGSSR